MKDSDPVEPFSSASKRLQCNLERVKKQVSTFKSQNKPRPLFFGCRAIEPMAGHGCVNKKGL